MKRNMYERPDVDIILSTVELGFALSQVESIEGDTDEDIIWD